MKTFEEIAFIFSAICVVHQAEIIGRIVSKHTVSA